MKILIIGSGGREHALAEAYAKSRRVKKVFVAPGNDLIEESSSKITTLQDIGVMDTKEIIKAAKEYGVDFVDVAQDDPLANGLVDSLSEVGIPSFGPTKKEAELEWNKVWSRDFMKKYKLPIPEFHEFCDEENAIDFVNSNSQKLWYVKASGLAAGKGAIKCETKEKAIEAIRQMKTFGKSGKHFLIEEGMVGEEFSLFAVCDGNSYSILGVAQDHKTVYNSDLGTNTGGMGSSVSTLLSKTDVTAIKKNILNPLMLGMKNEGRPYSGILYLGGMVTKDGIKIIEFNARWGDPEAEVLIPSLQIDYVDIVQSVMMQEISVTKIRCDNLVRISVAGCAKGYPDDYSDSRGKIIYGLEKVRSIPGVNVYGSGIKKKGKKYVVNGGRIFHLVVEGNTISEARKKAYSAMSQIYIEGNNLQYRTDIGWREIERSKK